MRRMGHVFGIPTSSVRTTAGAGGTAGLLDRRDAFAYVRLYFMHDLVVTMDVERRKPAMSVRAMECLIGYRAMNEAVLAGDCSGELPVERPPG
jgi:hypothetical protein